MKQGFFQQHWTDKNENPARGVSSGNGFTVSWQNGPLGRIGTSERREPNGAFVEDLIGVVIGRIAFYQKSKFACDENAAAIDLLKKAADLLQSRTNRRINAQTEGTHEGH